MKDSKYKFNGTKGKWYAVQYANFFNIQTCDFYIGEDDKPAKNVLDIEDFTEETVQANACLLAVAPDLLNTCIEALYFLDQDSPLQPKSVVHDKLKYFVSQALNFKNKHA